MLKKILILFLNLYLISCGSSPRNYIKYCDIEKLRIGIKQWDSQIVNLPYDFEIELTDSNKIKSVTIASRVVLKTDSNNPELSTEISIIGVPVEVDITKTVHIYYDYFLLTFLNGELTYWGTYDDYMRNENAYYRLIGDEFHQKSHVKR